MIATHQRPDEPTRTRENICLYEAEAFIDGQHYTARSRRGAPFALARVLVAAGISDQPVMVTQDGLRGAMTYRSLHRMAELTITGSASKPVGLRHFVERPDFGTGELQNRGESRSEVPEVAAGK